MAGKWTIWLLPFGVIVGFVVTFLVRSLLRLQSDATIAMQPYQHSERLRFEKEKLLMQLRAIDTEIDRYDRLAAGAADTTHSEELSTSSRSTGSPTIPMTCKYDFKVFVYPIPTSILALRIGEEARHNGTLHVCKKCILEQFALEYIVYDFFTQFCGRTYDPNEADFFYLPLIRDAEFRWTMQTGGVRQRAPSAAEVALLNVLEKNDSQIWEKIFNVTSKFWHRHYGADHIVVMPAPVTNLRHETSQRGFFHYMSHLHTPIFLGLEYSLSFIREYPICSSSKNIVVPYPTTDPDLFNGKLLSFAIERSALLYYAGGLHGDCVEIRKAMKHLMVNSTRLNHVVPKIKSIQEEREHGFLAATFCPVPIGDSPSSKRMYDVLNFGCIPVVLSDDLVWAFSDQTGGTLNHSLFAIHIPQSVVQFSIDRTIEHYSNRKEEFSRLPLSGTSLYDLLHLSYQSDSSWENGVYINPLVRMLRRVPLGDIEFLRRQGKAAGEAFRYYEMNSSSHVIPTSQHQFPTGGAMDMIAKRLSLRKVAGIDRLSDLCQQERRQIGHKYISRYVCDTDKTQSLI
jgi:hypothetical protein